MNALVPVVHVVDGKVFANSRDVAEFFGKRHSDVLRDVDVVMEGLRKSADTPWFTEVSVPNYQNGQMYRSFEMTRDGFTLLVMGYTGPKAMEFKVAYIARFNEMEAEIAARVPALPNFSNPAEAARAWALEYERAQEVEAKLIEASPVQ